MSVDWGEVLDIHAFVERVVGALPAVGAALVVLVAFWLGYRVTRPALKAMLGRAGLHQALVELLVDNLYRYALLAVAVVMAASQLGIDVAAAVAGLGVAGIAVGFAAQDALANVISGILIFWDKPFLVGDWITVEGSYGRVTDITLRSTRIRTPRNTYVVIPNKSIIDAVLENHSKHGEVRVEATVGIAYKEDIAAARQAILEAVREIEDIAEDPPPDVVVQALGGSSVDLAVRVWIERAALQRPVTFKVIEASKLALDRAGIQIPFPHLQLFVDTIEDRVWERLEALGTDGRKVPAGRPARQAPEQAGTAPAGTREPREGP